MSIMQRLPPSDRSRNPAGQPPTAGGPSPLADLLNMLSPLIRRATLDVVDGLLRSHAESADLPATVESIADRMVALNLPIDRLSMLAEAVSADADAIECIWTRHTNMLDRAAIGGLTGELSNSTSRLGAPAALDPWTDLRSADILGHGSSFVSRLKNCGITQLLSVPLPLAQGRNGRLLLMTADPAGFTPAHRAMMETLIPSIVLILAMRVNQTTYARLLRTYVGHGTHRAILSGIAKRGEAIPIRSAIFFADMRDSLEQTAGMNSFAQMDLLNDFFDCIVPPIEARGGEVLKFTGDGLLAIFPEQGENQTVASDALEAARAAVENLAALNAGRPKHSPIELGIGLHYGDAAYGNIGSGLRLDFTVVGRNIGLASRISDLNKVLSEPLLMSSSFADQLRGGGDPVGTFKVRGVSRPVSVFLPIAQAAAA